MCNWGSEKQRVDQQISIVRCGLCMVRSLELYVFENEISSSVKQMIKDFLMVGVGWHWTGLSLLSTTTFHKINETIALLRERSSELVLSLDEGITIPNSFFWFQLKNNKTPMIEFAMRYDFRDFVMILWACSSCHLTNIVFHY